MNAAAVYFVDLPNLRIFMEEVLGPTVKEVVRSLDLTNQIEVQSLASRIGLAIGQLHKAGVIHGDLTTSNMLERNDDQRSICLIDFGLSYNAVEIEDQAVDLYVMERAFICTHPDTDHLFSLLLETYQKVCPNGKAVLRKLRKVRLRGRKKLAFG
mmetsp:Transcript_11263/g.28413  ORF Transcript_11263/g.28413 Transcript_11263/m.28413 type:complete len:155 (-) Transcript_11263:42-506(-)